MAEIERASAKRDYARRMVARLKDAEKRGFKFNGTVTEKQLAEFETRGIQPKSQPVGKTSQDWSLTPADRERLRQKELDRIELENFRQSRRDDIKLGLKLAKTGLPISVDTKRPETTLYL